MTHRLLEGDVLEAEDAAQLLLDERDRRQLPALREENRRLSAELVEARIEVAAVKRETAQALANLRRQLSPLYRALQGVFGDLEAAGVGQDPEPSSALPARTVAIWENWKAKMPGYPARIIDALLLQRDLTTTQLAISCGCKSQRISEGILKLNKAGLINKTGGKFSLKSL